MSRTQSEGLVFFPFAVDFFTDKKIKAIKARYGADGISIYLYLLCYIYREGYYTRVDDDLYDVIADDLNMSLDKIQQVLTFLLGRSMFNEQLFKSDAILTSSGIQERWQKAVATRASKTPIKVGKYWLLSKAETKPYIKVVLKSNSSEKKADNSEKKADNSEKKDLKENKENKLDDINIISAEQTSCSRSSEFMSFPCKDGKYIISMDMREQLILDYKDINIDVELMKMKNWLLANSNKLKTIKGMPRFIVGWINNSYSSIPKQSSSAVISTEFNSNYNVKNGVMERRFTKEELDGLFIDIDDLDINDLI